MTMVASGGIGGHSWPENVVDLPNGSHGVGSVTLNGTTTAISFGGHAVFPAGSSRNVVKLWFRTGTNVTAGGSNVRGSLQDIDLVNGAPIRPDTSVDQSVQFTVPASNTFYQTAALDASRSVAQGARLGVVFEWGTGGRLGSDTFSLTGLALQDGASNMTNGCAALTSGTWSRQSLLPNVLLECDDGSFGTLFCCFPFSALSSTVSTNLNGTPDERAAVLTVPFGGRCVGWRFDGGPMSGSADFDVLLYAADGTTVLASSSLDANAMQNVGTTRSIYVPWSASVDLAAGDTVLFAVRPSIGASGVYVNLIDVANAAHWDLWPGGQAVSYAERTDAGVWTYTTTRRLAGAALFFSHLDIPAGGGGGGGDTGGLTRFNAGLN